MISKRHHDHDAMYEMGTPRTRRLLPHIIDQRARDEPDRPFYILAQELVREKPWVVSYRTFAQAIDRMSLWIDLNIGTGETRTTIAFVSQNAYDIRYWIVLVAAMKTSKVCLFPSPRNSAENNDHLLRTTGCHVIVGEAAIPSTFHSSKLPRISPPTLESLLETGECDRYPYTKTYEEVENHVAFIYHSSGSTGPPKPIPWTHGKVNAIIQCAKIPVPAGTERILDMYRAPGPHVSLLPFFHAAGFLFGMLWNSVFGNPFMTLPPGVLPTAANITMFLKMYTPMSLFAPPSILEDMASSEEMLSSLDGLAFIHFGGAGIAEHAGQVINGRVSRLYNSMGSTESACYPSLVPLKKSAMNYYYWPTDTPGVEFRESQGLYEMVFTRNRHFDWAIFHTFPDIDEYPTKDLYERHPTLPNHWKLVARTDDVLVLSSGEKVVPLEMEGIIRKSPLVKSVLVIGNKRFTTAALVELDDTHTMELDRRAALEAISPFVDEANRMSPGHARLSMDQILLTKTTSPMLRTAKGTVLRSSTLALYETEIEKLYLGMDDVCCDQDDLDLAMDVNEQATHEALQRSIKRVCSLEPPFDQDFFQAGLDSGNALALSRYIKKQLSKAYPGKTIKMSPGIIYTNPSICALSTALQNLVGGGSSDAHDNYEANMSKMIDKYMKSIPNSVLTRETPPKTSGRTVVLTGSTGSLGSYILHELISDEGISRIYALNRTEDAALRQSTSNSLKELSVDFDKVAFLHTTIDQDGLGLDAEQYRELSESVDLIIHNAWPVNFKPSLESFEPHVRGICNLIQIAAGSTYSAQIVFTSSIGTTSNWKSLHPSSGAPETLINDFRVPLGNGYSESKYISEHLLALAANAGVRATICRVGQIAGPVNKIAGLWNAQEWLPSLIQSSHHLHMLPADLGADECNVDWIPVDIMARILLELSTETTYQGSDDENNNEARVYNVINPKAISWRSLLPAILEYMPADTQIVPFDQWAAGLEVFDGNGDIDFVSIPAAKLMEFWEGMARGKHPSGLVTEAACRASETMRNVSRVNAEWLGRWMAQWGYKKLEPVPKQGKIYRYAASLWMGVLAAWSSL